jgi:MFS transporter, PAT family, beta-lactamase induction signal transducer AmpG
VTKPASEEPERKRNLAWVVSTYFGQGLPWTFLHQMATDYLTAIRAPVQQVGYTSWLHTATSFKFAWSPLVDLTGTKRRWMVVLQMVMGVGMFGVAFISREALGGLGMFWLSLALLAIVHATHDIACDGYYLLALSRRQQALYSGARVAAFRAAMLVGSSALVFLAGVTSWPMGFAAAGALMFLTGLGNALFVPRVPEPERKARSAGEGKRVGPPAFLNAYRTFFTQPHAGLVLAFIFCLKLGDIMTFAMSRPLMRDIGITTAQRGLLATPQMLGTMAGAILAGWVMSRYGLQRTLAPIIWFMALPLYILIAWLQPSFPWVVIIVTLEQFAGGMGSTAHTVYMMQRCRKQFSASHYAFASALVALGSTVTGGFSGHLNAALGHRWYFVICFAFSLPGMLLALIVPKAPIEQDAPPAQPPVDPAR